MTEAIIKGIILGAVLSVLIGPVFFMLIHVSIKEGFRSAMALDVGIILSDAFCILISWFGMAALLENERNSLIFTIIGAIVLVIFGLLKFKNPKTSPEDMEVALEKIEIKRSNPLLLGFQGFMYNLANPSTLIFWLTTVGAAVTVYAGKKNLIITQFSATLIVVFGIDIAKAWFAKKTRKFVTPQKLLIANKIMGVIFILFGIALVIKKILETNS